MTRKNEMRQRADNRGDKKTDNDSKKSEQDSKSTGHAGVKSSANKKPDKKSGVMSRMLLTIILACAVLVAYAYFYMPDTFNQYLSFSSAAESNAAESNNGQELSSAANTSQDYVPTAPVANYAMNNQAQQDEWASTATC